MSYFGIGILGCKKKVNIGTLWRSAGNFHAAFIFTIGPEKFSHQPSDTGKTFRQIPLFYYTNLQAFLESFPLECKLVGIEQVENSKNLITYDHPKRAIYLLGAEDIGLTATTLSHCHDIVSIDTPRCLNVSTAGSIVMYDRLSKAQMKRSEKNVNMERKEDV